MMLAFPSVLMERLALSLVLTALWLRDRETVPRVLVTLVMSFSTCVEHTLRGSR